MRTWRNRRAERELLAGIRANRPDRDPGIHLSSLIYCARKARHRLDHPELWAEGAPYRESDEQTVMFFLGEGHHGLVGGGTHKDKTELIDGILLTPDGVTEEAGVTLIKEYKTTRSSPRNRVGEEKNPVTKRMNGIYVDKGLESHGSYVDQLAGYCSLKGVARGRVVIFYIVQAEIRVHDIEFDQHELEGWRRELLKRRDMILKAPSWLAIGPEHAWSWECEHCALYQVECPGGGQRLSGFSYQIKDLELESACA